MKLNSSLVKASGPAVIAVIAVGVAISGAHSPNQAKPAKLEQKPLSDEIRVGAIDIGPVVAPMQMTAEKRVLRAPKKTPADLAIGADIATASLDHPLHVDGYKRYLEVRAFKTRGEATRLAAALRGLDRRDKRLGGVEIVHEPKAISNPFRVQVGPFAADVTNADVRAFKTRFGYEGARVVSRVDAAFLKKSSADAAR
ncbi:MAG: hypothetical protein MRY74_04470 [Neomegalonema sp.]|nr:hypothetical protein [Neomegalonema sp.]